MASFYLRKYTRNARRSSVGTFVAEWKVEAPDKEAAIQLAKERLASSGFKLRFDCAILRDGDERKVWDQTAQS